jgi:hypothetical protein|tara:strand:- start:202 stop:456 length:255 start_codon:yes stop_codon:yes gene_type:complete
MQETDPLYEFVRTVMLEVMAVLYANGQRQLHVGAMMRLIGVDEERAAMHDDDRIDIDESFAELANDVNIKHLLQSRIPDGATIH